MRTFATAIAVAAIYLAVSCCAAQDAPRPFADSLKTEEDLAAMFKENVLHVLISGEKNLADWADELESTPPKTPNDVWITCLVCLRAGRDETVCKMFPLLFNIIDTMPPELKRRFSNDFQISSLEKLPPTRWKVFTTYHETFDTISYHQRSIYRREDFIRAGWTDEELAQWYEKRWQNACAREPEDWDRHPFDVAPKVFSSTASGWHTSYLHQLCDMGRLPAEIERLNKEAKESPQDQKKWALLFNALLVRRSTPAASAGVAPDLEWLMSTAEKRTAFEAWTVANDLDRFDTLYQKICEPFLVRALAEPLTAEECDMYRRYLQSSSMRQPERSNELIRAMFFVSVMDELNRLYLSDNRNDAAQKIMLEARELRKEYNLGEANFLAGMTQAGSGQRVVEREILDSEAEDEMSYAYWMRRASYYEGRSEPQEEEKALRKALELSDTPEKRKQGGNYRNVNSTLLRFLVREKRFDDAAAFFRERRDLVRNEPRPLWELYYDSRNVMTQADKYNELEKMFFEDVKAAMEWFRENPKPTSQDPEYVSDYRVRQSLVYNYHLVRYSPQVILELIDFANDPFAWEYLNHGEMRSNPLTDNFILFLLFSSDKENVLNEAVLKSFERALKEDKLVHEYNYFVGNALCRQGYYEKAMPFFKEALQKEGQNLSTVLHWSVTCSLALGDWRLGETYAVEYFLRGGLDERNLNTNLRKIADLADEAGEAEEAERIRRRIANLGW